MKIRCTLALYNVRLCLQQHDDPSNFNGSNRHVSNWNAWFVSEVTTQNNIKLIRLIHACAQQRSTYDAVISFLSYVSVPVAPRCMFTLRMWIAGKQILQHQFNCCLLVNDGPGIVISVATGYGLDGPGSNPGGGEIFRTCPHRPWGPPSLLYNGYWVFPGGKERSGRDADPSPPSSAVVKKG